MENAKAITLEALLSAREQRAQNQKKLIDAFDANVISFTVNTPGKFKDALISRKIHYEGRRELEEVLMEKKIPIVYEEVYYKTTGAEAFIVVDMDAVTLKKMLVEVEECHPLGRLFDFDVIDKKYNMITRAAMNRTGRKCLLCEEDASICVRSQKHPYDVLIEKIRTLTREYFEESKESK
ncbi:MAG: citrate lyase holo-[acyl-carrier protein] synthase [Firmicutes bacterium]|nr:citrate lyase holo-[acyl-carrier protein] synthase [Bacillota bacterium]